MSEFDHKSWDYVSLLCEDLIRRMPQAVTETVQRIRTALPDYRVVDETEHQIWVRGQYRMLVNGIAQRRGPTREEVDLARSLGARRAAQGLALKTVVAGFHIGYQYLWDVALHYARRDGNERSADLLGVIDLVWTWIQALTSSAAEGHSTAVQAEQAQRLDAGHRLIEALYAGQSRNDATVLVARCLNFDPTGRFGAACLVAGPEPDIKLECLRQAWRRLGATAHAETRGATVILVVQGINPLNILNTADLTTTPGGVGLMREGLGGLELSIRDAEKAMALSAHRGAGVVDFGKEWLASTLFSERCQLSPILAPQCEDVPSHITDGMLAFAAHGFSIAAAAEDLHIHPNTMKYRLDRWRNLTGWDPRTLEGLLASICFIALRHRQPRRGGAVAIHNGMSASK